tara:strand:- start:1325 stop:1609 length:285 start_codon:yes stop_codon:yes gene_type:complete
LHIAHPVLSSNLAAILQINADGMGAEALPKAMATKQLADGTLFIDVTLIELNYGWTPNEMAFQARYCIQRTMAHIAKKPKRTAMIATQFSDNYL